MAELDKIIHEQARLRIMAALTSLTPDEQADFVYLRNLLKLTDGNLGAHVARLEAAGYVKIRKVFVDRKPRTYIRTTGKGRDAFDEHVAALRDILKKSGCKEGEGRSPSC